MAILAAAVGTLMMGLYARRPFAVAPLMGGNAFIAFTAVKLLGFSWQVAFGAVFFRSAYSSFLRTDHSSWNE